MKFTFIEKKMAPSDSLRAYAEKKVSKIDRLFRTESEANVTFSTERGRFTAEITIKNNGNDVDAKAVLYRGGEEIDTGGTAYTYTWKLWNSAGTSVVKTYTGKSITVSKADVTGKGVLMCEVSK